MPDVINLIGQRFGHWLVLSQGKRVKNKIYWVCQCDCGNVKEVNGQSLRDGVSTCCGWNCKVSVQERHDRETLQAESKLVGKKFGRLTVKGFSGEYYEKDYDNHHYRERLWDCECECGKHIKVRKTALFGGKVKSCGCLFDDINKEKRKMFADKIVCHSLSETPTLKEIVGTVLNKPCANVDPADIEEAITLMFPQYWQRMVRTEQTAKRKYCSWLKHGNCDICGKESDLEWHHKQPVSLFGGNEPNNVMLICNDCHKKINKAVSHK